MVRIIVAPIPVQAAEPFRHPESAIWIESADAIRRRGRPIARFVCPIPSLQPYPIHPYDESRADRPPAADVAAYRTKKDSATIFLVNGRLTT
jgi:hypothetical protein